MWLRRLAALVVAVALVAGAFVIRERRSPTGGRAAPGDGPPSAGGFTLVCATELAALCAGLGAAVTVRIESAAGTAGALQAAPLPRQVADAWLTVDPWPALSDLERTRSGAKSAAFTTAPAVLGHSPVGVALRRPRATVLAAACQGAVTLACVGENGRRTWVDLGGRADWQVLKPTFSDPASSATGPAALSAAIRQRRADADLGKTDLEADSAFMRWLGAFLRPPPLPGTSSLADAITRFSADAVVLPQAEFAATAGADAQFDFVPASAFDAQLVLAAVGDARVPDAVRRAVAGRAQAGGWAPGATAAPPVDANLVAGFQVVWRENA